MDVSYKNNYSPKLTFQKLDEGDKFLEIPRACYQSNDFTKNDILVYSIILSSTNDEKTQYCYYTNQSIAEKINLSINTIKRSISKLQKLKYIKIVIKDNNKREIYPLIDLRYNESDNKSTIKIYYRLFWYPNIDITMIHIYSYYLSFSDMDKYKTSCDISLTTVSKSLNITYRALLKNLLEMEKLKLISIIRKKNGNIVSIKLLVDFSKVQVEEQKEINKIKSLMDKNFKDEMESIEDDTIDKSTNTVDKPIDNTTDESIEEPIEDAEDESTNNTMENSDDSDDSEYNDIFIDNSKPSRLKLGFEMEEGIGYNFEPIYHYEADDDEIEF